MHLMYITYIRFLLSSTTVVYVILHLTKEGLEMFVANFCEPYAIKYIAIE